MKKDKVLTIMLIIAGVIIFVLLGINAGFIYHFIIKGADDTVMGQALTQEDVTEDVDTDTTVTDEDEIPEALEGKDVTLLTGDYLEVTVSQGNGSISDYVDETCAVTLIKTNNGDVFEQYQTDSEIYAYAYANDEDGGTTSAGVAHYAGDVSTNLSKTALAEMYEKQYRDMFDKMKPVKVVGHDWVYLYKGVGEKTPSDIMTLDTTVYVDYASGRVSKLLNPYITLNFHYSSKQIKPVYTPDDFKAMGAIQEVEDKNDILNMAWAYTSAITKYDEEYLAEKTKQIQEIIDLGNELGGLQNVP